MCLVNTVLPAPMMHSLAMGSFSLRVAGKGAF